MAVFGNCHACSYDMDSALSFLSAISEPGRLVLLGFCLIGGALFLRKLLFPLHTALDPASNAHEQAK